MKNKSFIVLKLTTIVMLSVIVGGCMHTSSGIVPLDKDNYYISQDDSRLGMGPPGVETISAVYKEANEFCSKKIKKLKELITFILTLDLRKEQTFHLNLDVLI